MAMRGHLLAAAFFILFGLAPATADDFAYVEANGIRFAYIEEGSGPLILLMHGYPETALLGASAARSRRRRIPRRCAQYARLLAERRGGGR